MRSGDTCGQGTGRQRGFGYLLALFALATIGLLLAGAGQVWQVAAQREKEADLLFAGEQFGAAIASYYRAGPDAVKQYPPALDDLLEDRRFSQPKRHLRRLYRDPMTGSHAWGQVRVGGRVIAVHSLGKGTPLKTVFELRHAAFAGATRYDQWVFGDGAIGPATIAPLPTPSAPGTAVGQQPAADAR